MSILDRFKKQAEDPKKASVAKKVAKKESGDKATKKVAKKTEKKTSAPASKINSASKKATQTLLAPIVTEKSAQLADQDCLVFRVAKNANRIAIRNAFRELYNVTPVRVNIISSRGTEMRFGRVRGRTKDTKKAIIKLPKGVKVDIFEGV